MGDEIHLVESRKRVREDYDDEEVELFAIIFGFISVVICSWHHINYREKEIAWSEYERVQKRKYWMDTLMNDRICREQLRVDRNCFDKLCHILKIKGGLKTSRNVTVKEVVAYFLHILAHDLKNRTIGAVYTRSGETISRHFHMVLRALMKIGQYYVKQTNSSICFARDSKWKWFEEVVGALDGTHIDMTVSEQDRPRYRNRKGDITTNVLATCDNSLRFGYVLPGWEGSTSDPRVLSDALRRPNGLKIPTKKYYLVDLGYTNGPGFLGPYKRTRYHLNLWRGNTPTNYKELFNLRHSSARNTIERAFGLLKKRWAILRTSNFYDKITQEHPNAAPYQNKSIDYWDDICTLCGPDRALGDGVETHDEAAAAMDDELESEGVSSSKSMSSSRTKRQRRDRLADAVASFTECFRDYVQSKPKEAAKPTPQEVHDVVKNVDGIGRHQIMKAARMFTNGPVGDFEMLKALPSDEKLDWVLECLNDQY